MASIAVNPQTVNLSLLDSAGRMPVDPIWQGQHTFLHKPIDGGTGQPKQVKATYVLTHADSGLAFGTLNCNQQQARKIARAWDDRCGSIDPANAAQWEHKEAWGQVLRNINEAWTRSNIATTAKVKEQWGNTKSNVGSQDLALLLAAKQGLAIDQAGRSKKIRWRGKFWTAPSEAELNYWTFDSVCETPDGRTVEPDHPESWLRILGLV